MRSRVTIRRVTEPYKPAARVHSRGVAPTPERAIVEGSGRVLQGGLPPVPYRSTWNRTITTSKWGASDKDRRIRVAMRAPTLEGYAI